MIVNCVVATFFFAIHVFGLQHPSLLKTDDEIKAGYLSDGWEIKDNLITRNGYRGFFAESINSTILGTGEKKRTYYVEGRSFDMGWLHGALSARRGDARAICTTYIHHIVINLLDETWDQEMASKCEGCLNILFLLFFNQMFAGWIPGAVDREDEDGMSCETYETLLDFLEKWLITGSVKSFHNEKYKFPQELIDEMEAFVEGAIQEDPECGCTYEKIIYLNYGIDFLMSALYAGQLPHIISREAQASSELGVSLPPRVVRELFDMSPTLFRIPYFCNSFVAVNNATNTGKDIFMSRDFQLPTGIYLHIYIFMFSSSAPLLTRLSLRPCVSGCGCRCYLRPNRRPPSPRVFRCTRIHWTRHRHEQRRSVHGCGHASRIARHSCHSWLELHPATPHDCRSRVQHGSCCGPDCQHGEGMYVAVLCVRHARARSCGGGRQVHSLWRTFRSSPIRELNGTESTFTK